MTISSPKTIETMLKNKGVYPGDPAMDLIFSYKSPDGKQLFACFDFEKDCPNDIYESPFVVNPVLLMETGKLTQAGKAFLKNLEGPSIE